MAGTNAALSFDGVNGWVRMPDHPALDGFNGDFTVEAWFRIGGPLPFNHYPVIVSKGRANSGPTADFGWGIQILPSGRLGTWIGGGGPQGLLQVVFSSNPLTPIVSTDAWHHVALRRSGSLVSVFLDGVLNNSYAFALTVSDSTYPLGIGAGPADQAPVEFFPGKIDEVRVWSIARSDSDLSYPANANVLIGSEFGLV
ncbi:MAG: LamG domain-containing protein, partial [Clostridia bacterium]|nr:LamG domain-containing protein [Deltaproteobacteria bacterium]